MNIIDLQERLKDLPEQALMQEMQMPTGTAPQFLVLSELKRRKRMRDEYQRQQAQGMQTVAEETITAAGMPQQGIMGLAQGMAPKSAIAQNTGVNDMMQREATRAPQPEQPMMMASGGYVQRMQEGGFSGRQQQGYLIFLQDMGLQDSPESRDMYVRMMERQQERGVSPTTFMPFIDRAPEAVSLADVSTDVGAFMPGADAQPPRMTAPVLGSAPSAGTIDFDASVSAAPEAPLLFSRDVLAELDSMGVDPADFARLSEEEQQNILGFEDITAPMRQRFAEAAEAEAQPTAPSESRMGIEDIVGVGDLEYGDIPEGAGGGRSIMEMLGFGPAMEKARESQAIADAREEAARAPRPVEDQALSFGLPPADLPTTGAELSFGGITPSAADIPLSTGREGAAEPTPEFPLGTPVEAPAAAISSATGGTGGGGAGGGGYGPIESRIARMLEERERSAEADKWLALAQTGLALMASDQPTIGGAIGEAGLAGIGALQKARSQYDKDIMELLNMQAGVQRARAAGARASTSTSALNSMIDDARQELSNLTSEARSYRQISADPITGEPRLVDMTPDGLRAQIIVAQDRLAQLNALRSGSAATAQFDATAQ